MSDVQMKSISNIGQNILPLDTRNLTEQITAHDNDFVTSETLRNFGRIVQGTKVGRRDRPWFVELTVHFEGNSRGGCGASILGGTVHYMYYT